MQQICFPRSEQSGCYNAYAFYGQTAIQTGHSHIVCPLMGVCSRASSRPNSPQTQNQMQRTLLLDVVVRKSTTIFELLACEDQALLIWRNAFFILDFRLDVVDRVASLHIQGDRFARQSLHEDLHTSAKAQDQVQCALFLDVVIRKSTTILELFACEDQALLIRRNAFLILDFRLNVVDRVASLHIQSDRFARQGLHEDLHTSAKAQDQVQGALFLDVVVRKSTTIFELLACEDQALLI